MQPVEAGLALESSTEQQSHLLLHRTLLARHASVQPDRMMGGSTGSAVTGFVTRQAENEMEKRMIARGLVVAVFGHTLEGIPRCEGAECALHVGIDDRQAVNVGRIDPAKTTHYH